MSDAKPLGNAIRENNYALQHPGRPLTPAQNRRLRKKANKEKGTK